MLRDSTPATNVISLRNALGMNQVEFAKALLVSQGVVSDWERGVYAPSAESYVNLGKLAAKYELPSEALWFLEQTGVGGTELIAATRALVRESHARRDALYRDAFIEAQTLFPDDAIAQHRYATKTADRALRRRRKAK